jgi:PAS domain S-box-containing protein
MNWSFKTKLRVSEARFRNMADTAPVMIWVTGADNLATLFNKQWLTFTGCSSEEELAGGWIHGVHPDDRDRCFDPMPQNRESDSI